MRKKLFLPLFFCLSLPLYANGPQGREFGFGIIFGNPLGGTMKFWTSNTNAFTVSLGEDYFGSPRITADYLWHFNNAFHSNVVSLYAGPGVAFGMGHGQSYLYYKVGPNSWYYRAGGETEIGVRGMVGVDIDPTNTPIEIFLELGPLMGITPGYGVTFDAALGIRFYP